MIGLRSNSTWHFLYRTSVSMAKHRHVSTIHLRPVNRGHTLSDMVKALIYRKYQRRIHHA
ncbi:hypothetical protein Hanom_Chr10g00895461 [Helianthus anomalus]